MLVPPERRQPLLPRTPCVADRESDTERRGSPGRRRIGGRANAAELARTRRQSSPQRWRRSHERFSAAWLTLREPYDRRARNPRARCGGCRVRIGEPRCGGRSGLRHRLDLARARPRLPARQNWRAGRQRPRPAARSAAAHGLRRYQREHDPGRSQPRSRNGARRPVDLVTTSALLDLVSDEWLERFVVETAARRLPVYAALSYDGRIEMTPADPLDAAMSPPSMRISAPTRDSDRRSDPGAAAAIAMFEARRLFGRAGRVRLGVRDRRSRDPDRAAAGLGRCGARNRDRCRIAEVDRLADATAMQPSTGALIDARRSRRFLRHAERHALSRQVAVEQHIVLDPVQRASASARAWSARSIGGKREPGPRRRA